MTADRDRRRQILSGVGVVIAVSLLLAGLFSIQFVPGPVGEAAGWLAGVMTTPFILETGLFVIGFSVVILLNHWRQKREGDEFVFLEEVKNPPADLPAQARWAIYKEQPLEAGELSAKDQLEGALAIGDHESALQILTAMPDAERNTVQILRLRIQLARATGLNELADRLEGVLKEAS